MLTTAVSPSTCPGQLPRSHLVLAVRDCLEGTAKEPSFKSLPTIQDRLWREDPDEVAQVYDGLLTAKITGPDPDNAGTHGLLAERLRASRRPLPSRNRPGLTLQEIAQRADIHRATLAALMEEHGYLELVPYGGKQSRRLVTEEAFDAELGHNVDPSHTRLWIEGANRTAPFPVFYEDKLEDIIWSLDYEGITQRVRALPDKRRRLEFLLKHHPTWPAQAMARLSGYGIRTVETERARIHREQVVRDTRAVTGYL